MFVGTPNYSSPEQVSGGDVDARADIYATGVMLCEMFCGQLPFRGSNTMEMYIAHLQSAPIRPREMWPDIAPELEAIILKCLEKSPDQRFASAGQLRDALSQLRA
jgi:eukaryotic-like serine/threonine-protein kinase